MYTVLPRFSQSPFRGVSRQDPEKTFGPYRRRSLSAPRANGTGQARPSFGLVGPDQLPSHFF